MDSNYKGDKIPERGKKMNELKDTIEMMDSADYKERFKAEYMQTKIRYDKLHAMVTKYEAGTLHFQPTCPINLLKEQKAAMGLYLQALEVRAEMEGIELRDQKHERELTRFITIHVTTTYKDSAESIDNIVQLQSASDEIIRNHMKAYFKTSDVEIEMEDFVKDVK